MERQGILISREKAMFAFFVTLGLIAAFLRAVYKLPLSSSLAWFVGVFVCFYLPGKLLQRLLKCKEQEYFVSLAHAIALGVALVPVVYTIFRIFSLPWLLYPFFGGLSIIWIIMMIRDWPRREEPQTDLHDLLVILILGVVVLILLHLSHFTDIVFEENGFSFKSIYLNETIFHLGIINALKNAYPPFFPYESGIGFSQYHLNMHLEIEMFNRLFGIDTMLLSYFLFPLLYFCLLVYLPYLFVRKYLGSRVVGVFTGVVVFCSDLSYIPALFGLLPQNPPWNSLFNATIWPLLTLNGFLPAMVVFFLAILHLKEYFANGRSGDILLFSLLGFAGYGFKSSLGPHIMAAACLTGLLLILRNDRQKGKVLIISSLLTVFVMSLDMIIFRSGSGTNIVTIAPFDRYKDALLHLGIERPSSVLLMVTFPLALAVALGASLFGLRVAAEGFRKKTFDPMLVFLSFFIAIGFILSEILFLGPIVPQFLKINNAMWFSFPAATIAWLLVSYFLAGLEKEKKNVLLAICLILLVSLPGTIQFLTLRIGDKFDLIGVNAREVISYLENTPPNAVVLHPRNMTTPSLASNFAGRRSVLAFFRSYVIHYTDLAESERRLKDIETFFSDSDIHSRPSILEKYHVTHVYAPLSYSRSLDREQMLQPVFQNAEYVVYRVTNVYNKGQMGDIH